MNAKTEEKGEGEGEGDEKENSEEHLKNVLESIEEKTQRPPHLMMVLPYTLSKSFSQFNNTMII